MPGPWEKYAAARPAQAQGPWSKYAAASKEQPDEMSWGKALVQNTPLVPSAIDLAKGEYVKGSGADVAGRISGDVGAAAGLAAPFLAASAAGAPLGPVGVGVGAATGAGALIGAALEKSGFSPNQRKIAEGIRAQAPPVEPFQESNDGFTKAYQYARSIGGQVPNELGATAHDLIPTVLGGLAMKLGMAGAAKMKSPVPNEAPAPTPQQLRALELKKAGYPVTVSHGIEGDVRLKQAMLEPQLAAESKAYHEQLGAASRGDVGRALGVGAETTQTLGEAGKTKFNDAKSKMNETYKGMLAQAEKQRGPEMTGVGELTHAGKALERSVYADFAKQGLKITPEIKAKALGIHESGKPLSLYDMPSGKFNPDEVTAAIRFADLAGQKAPSALELNELARNFADSEKIFSSGGGPGANRSGFLKGIRNKATDMAGDLIKKRDAARGVEGTPQADYPQWEQQRANWAKHADLVDEFNGKMSSAKTRTTGEKMYSAEEISPEKLFTQEFKNAGVNKIKEFKQFLEDNGQKPEIMESMAKDWLNDLGNKASDPASGVAAIEREWRGLSPEKKNAFFSSKTIKQVDAALGRSKAARAPLEVMDTSARGNSDTSKWAALQNAFKTGEGAVHAGTGIGTAIGGSIGGFAGAGIGGALGAGAGKMLANSKNAARVGAARNLMTGQEPIVPPAKAPGMMQTAKTAAYPYAAKLGRMPQAQTAGLGMLGPVTNQKQAADKARRLAGVR